MTALPGLPPVGILRCHCLRPQRRDVEEVIAAVPQKGQEEELWLVARFAFQGLRFISVLGVGRRRAWFQGSDCSEPIGELGRQRGGLVAMLAREWRKHIEGGPGRTSGGHLVWRQTECWRVNLATLCRSGHPGPAMIRTVGETAVPLVREGVEYGGVAPTCGRLAGCVGQPPGFGASPEAGLRGERLGVDGRRSGEHLGRRRARGHT